MNERKHIGRISPRVALLGVNDLSHRYGPGRDDERSARRAGETRKQTWRESLPVRT